jgi:hypothetical protein
LSENAREILLGEEWLQATLPLRCETSWGEELPHQIGRAAVLQWRAPIPFSKGDDFIDLGNRFPKRFKFRRSENGSRASGRPCLKARTVFWLMTASPSQFGERTRKR